MRFANLLSLIDRFLPLLVVAVLLLSSLTDAAPTPASTKKTPTTTNNKKTSPSPSPVPAATVPKVTEIQQFFTTTGKTAVFWCGQTDGKSVGTAAEKYAKTQSPPGTVVAALYRTAKKNPAWKKEWTTLTTAKATSQQMWGLYSEAFAKGAEGEAQVYWGDCPNAEGGAVWRTIEYPALKQNSKVTKIYKIEANNNNNKVEMPK